MASLTDMSYMKKIAILLFIITFSVMACTARYKESVPVRGVYHEVKKDVTLWKIAQTYNVDIQELAEINNITDPTIIEVGTIVFIPNAAKILEVEPTVRQQKPPKDSTRISKPAKKGKRKVKEKSKKESVRFERERFVWPVKGVVSSKFGIQPNGMRFNGIKIVAREGTPVLASANGRVIHSSYLKYYGETIIIKHKNNYSTVYAYLKDRKVNLEDTVKKGEKIALLGKYKKNGKSCLHFEIRRKNKPKNPLFYLPKSKNGKSGRRKK